MNEAEIRKDQNRFLRAKTKEWRGQNDAIYNETLRLLKEPDASIETVHPIICERFGCTNRRIDNVFKRRSGASSPKAQAMGEAQLLTYLEKVGTEIGYQVQDFVRQLDDIDMAESEGKKFVEIEMVEANDVVLGVKKTTKSVALDVARNTVKKQLLDTMTRFPEIVAKLKGNQTILQVENKNVFSTDTMADIANQIKVMEQQHNIKGGVSNENPRGQEDTTDKTKDA